MFTSMWCRSCGARSLAGEVEQLELIASDLVWSSPDMQCLNCSAPGLDISPTASKITERILFHIMTKGVVRVGYTSQNPHDIPTTGSSETARSYIGEAAAALNSARKDKALESNEKPEKIRLSTHNRTGYVLGHINTEVGYARCHCKMV